MARVTVPIPRVVARLTSCDRSIESVGATLAEALRELARREPALERPLDDGDTITIVNSLAGG